ncbi:hypothetical protein B0H14DRAFT_3901002 [Mycena olivaceomarginata]|nr:hypothetical protein B0H14DRAFT_3901002 [Mycena olivaceomarginata]
MSTDCPILVWMLSLNREYTKEEYDACHKVVDDCVQHIKIPYDPPNADTFRHDPHAPAAHDAPTAAYPAPNGATASRQMESTGLSRRPNDMPPEKVPPLNDRRKVINIGLGIKQVAVEPHGVSVKTYIESMAHKLTPPEMQSIALELGGEVVLRRLCILLALKAAYIKAIGQPAGFDWARLEFDIPLEAARADGHPLQGWEFRIFRASLGVARKDVLVEEHYQCSAKDLESWVQFINVDQMVNVIPKLTA